jgi:hypothetical protein
MSVHKILANEMRVGEKLTVDNLDACAASHRSPDEPTAPKAFALFTVLEGFNFLSENSRHIHAAAHGRGFLTFKKERGNEHGSQFYPSYSVFQKSSEELSEKGSHDRLIVDYRTENYECILQLPPDVIHAKMVLKRLILCD